MGQDKKKDRGDSLSKRRGKELLGNVGGERTQRSEERTTSQPSAGSIERALNEQLVVVVSTARRETGDG